VQRCRRLRKLRLTLSRRLSRLEKRLNVLGSSSPQERDIVVAYVAIEALNAWALFSRSFYLSCALGTRTERNKRVSVAASTVTDHIGFAITHFKKSAKPNSGGTWHRRDEPTWHDPNVLMTVCKNLGCSIQGELEAAFSLQQTVFKNLPVFRNFFAHRNEGTSRAARNVAPQYTLPTYISPAELLLTVGPGAHSSLLLMWLDEIRITAEFICRA
jgi:hypothetical protein